MSLKSLLLVGLPLTVTPLLSIVTPAQAAQNSKPHLSSVLSSSHDSQILIADRYDGDRDDYRRYGGRDDYRNRRDRDDYRRRGDRDDYRGYNYRNDYQRRGDRDDYRRYDYRNDYRRYDNRPRAGVFLQF